MRGERADAELLSSGTRVGKSEPNTGDDRRQAVLPSVAAMLPSCNRHRGSEPKQMGGRREAAPGQEAP